MFGLYLIGIAVAVLTGLIMKHTLLLGQTAPFVMELPPYHLPTVRGILLRSWERTRSFMFRAGKIIVPMVLVLNVLNAVGTDGSFGNQDSDQSVLSEIGRSITPAFAPMGMNEDNWPAAVGLFTGVLAKEAVVGTLDALYSDLAIANIHSASELLLSCIDGRLHADPRVRLVRIVDKPVADSDSRADLLARTRIPRSLWDSQDWVYVGLDIYLGQPADGGPDDCGLATEIIGHICRCAAATGR